MNTKKQEEDEDENEATQKNKYENAELLSQVRDEHTRGLNEVTAIRNDFIEEDLIFFDQRKEKESIGDTTFFNVVWAYMARTYTERPIATFEPKEFNQMYKYFVDNLNAVKDADLESEDFENLRFQLKFDTYRYGVGIMALTGWDGVAKKPIFEVVKPACVIPDPDGNYQDKTYNFIGFETQKRKDQLPDYYDKEALTFTKKITANDASLKQANDILDISNDTYNPVYDVYYHFTTYKGDKYLTVTGNNDSFFLYIEKLEAVTKEEKKENNLIPFPVLINNWRPDRSTIFGQRLATICKNTQMAIVLIQNLRYKKDKKELYPMYLYNTRLIKRPADLDMGFNKFIPTNPDDGESINNAIAPFPNDVRSDNSASITEMLQTNISRSTSGIGGNVAQGTTPEGRQTLGVQNMVQNSTDVSIALDDKIQSWFDRDFLRLWLRSYLENFKSGDKKIAKVKTGMGFVNQQLSQDQFLGYVEVSISVIPTSEKEKKELTNRTALGNTFNMLNAMKRPQIAQDLHARDMLEANGVDPMKAELYVPQTPQEIIAYQENILLNEAMDIPINETDDHLTHLIIHKGCLETVAVLLHNQAHLDAYTRIQAASPQLDPGMVQADQSSKNIQSSMTGANMAQQNAQQSQAAQ